MRWYLPKPKIQDELIEELMDLIETRKLSHLFREVAKRLRADRNILIYDLHQEDPEAINYLSEEENLLEALAKMLEEIENGTQYEDKKTP